MLTGRFDDSSGRPYFVGHVLLPPWRVTYDKPDLRLVADVATADAHHVF